MRSISAKAILAAIVVAAPTASLAWEATPRWTTAGRIVTRDADAAGPVRVGFPVHAGLSTSTHGRWRDVPGGGRTWTLEVASPGALWIVLGFDGYDVPQGARLTVFDSGGREVAVRTADDVRAHGQLWIPPVDGDSLRVELSWPGGLRRETPELVLSTVTHGFAAWNDPGAHVLAGGLTDCNVDASCSPEGDAWQGQRRGVVHMVIGGNGAFCTGSLINTTANLGSDDDVFPAGMRCAPFLLTADHCFDSGGTAESTILTFNYEEDPTGPCVDGLAPAASVAPRSQKLTLGVGATTIANYDTSDFRLLLLDKLPPREFEAYLSGWNRSSDPATEIATIHHPTDLPKKITRAEVAPVDGTLPGHWRINQWADGAPEPGSSGAPYFDQNRRIVGQHHGGLFTSGCDTPGTDEFGKLSASWFGGGAEDQRLLDHLDPVPTGVTTLDGLDLQTCLTRAPGVVPVEHRVDDGTISGDGVADPGEVLRLEVDLFNGGAVPATGVSATLAPKSGVTEVTVLDPDSAWSDVAPLDRDASQFPHFSLSLDETMTCGATKELLLEVTTDQFVPTEFTIDLETGTPEQTFFDDGDSGNTGFFCKPGLCVGGDAWTPEAPWGHADASWFIADNVSNTDAALVAPSIRMGNLARGSELRFRHRMSSETGLDGGVLEYSTDGGAIWLDAYDLDFDGFYDSTILATGDSAIKGQPAWSGVFEGWRTVVVDLDSFGLGAGDLDLRWRFVTDSGGTAAGGWSVDDIEIVGGGFTCKVLSPFPGVRCSRDDPDDRFPCGQRTPARRPSPTKRTR